MKKLLMLTTAMCAFATFEVQAQDVTAVQADVAQEAGVQKAHPDAKGKGKGGKFKRLDKDGDGFISSDEMSAEHAEKFKRMDADGDGKVSKSEMKAAKKKMKEHRENKGEKREMHKERIQERREEYRENNDLQR